MLALERARQPQHHLLGHLLDRGRDVHVERSEQLRLRVAHFRAKQLGEFRARHGEPGAIVEIVEIEPERAVIFEVDQGVEDEVDIFRLPIGREPHQLVLAGVDAKTGVVGKGRVEQPERVRELELLDQGEPLTLAHAHLLHRV